MVFKPGQSGNPNGRPKEDAELKAHFRKMSWTAANVLLTIARNPKAQERARVMAAVKILEYGIGKPVQPIEGLGDDGAIVVKVLTLTSPDEDDRPPPAGEVPPRR